MAKLLIATDNFLPRKDGVCRFVCEMMDRLKDFEITVAAPKFSDVQNSKWNIHWISTLKFRIGDYRPANPFSARKKLKKLVKGCDIVFAQGSGPISGQAVLYAKKYKKPCAIYVHYLDWELVPKAVKNSAGKRAYKIFLNMFSPYIYNKADLLILPSQGIGDELTWKNINVERAVVHLGVEHESFAPPKSKEEAKKNIGIEPDYLVLGAHTRLSREKDIITLLRGFIRLKKRFNKLRLLVVGDGIPEIKDTLKKYEGVILTGEKDDVVPYLQAMDVYCLTSLTETTCLATLEAMSCELPVIATPVGFVKDYVEDGETGFFIPFRNPYALAKNAELLLDDKELRQRMGEAGRKNIMKFRWRDTAEQIQESLNGLLKGR